MAEEHAAQVSSGVESLIQRLRQEGVAAGQSEAERIVSEAEARAEWLVKQAAEEAERIRERARRDAEHLQRTGRDALHAAARDALLSLKGELTQRFTGEVKRLVADEVKREEILQQMILELVAAVRPTVDASQAVEVLLPQDVVGMEELSRHPEALEDNPLTQFVRIVSAEKLREGVTLQVGQARQHGLQLVLKDQNIVLDLSDEALAEMLLAHLQPRFRALLDGIVR